MFVFFVCLITSLSITYAVKNLNGPFNMFGIFRNFLFKIPILGVEFFSLFECSYCVGFHVGWITAMLFNFNIQNILAMGFIAALCSLVLEMWIDSLLIVK